MKRRDASGRWDVPVSDGNGPLHVGKPWAVWPASALAEWLPAKFCDNLLHDSRNLGSLSDFLFFSDDFAYNFYGFTL